MMRTMSAASVHSAIFARREMVKLGMGGRMATGQLLGWRIRRRIGMDRLRVNVPAPQPVPRACPAGSEGVVDFLESAAAEIEAHVAGSGWDQRPALFALVRASRFAADDPETAARLRLTDAGNALTPIEQE